MIKKIAISPHDEKFIAFSTMFTKCTKRKKFIKSFKVYTPSSAVVCHTECYGFPEFKGVVSMYFYIEYYMRNCDHDKSIRI